VEYERKEVNDSGKEIYHRRIDEWRSWKTNDYKRHVSPEEKKYRAPLMPDL